MIKYIFWLMWISGAIAVAILFVMIANGDTSETLVSITIGLMVGLYVSVVFVTFTNGTDYPDNNDIPEQ